MLAEAALTPSFAQDREILRPLAEQLSQLASRPSMPALADRITRHNRLDSDGPLVQVFPEGAWEEIIPMESCRCADPVLRETERWFRAAVFQATEIRDDSVVRPFAFVSPIIHEGGYGVEIPRRQGDHRGSYVWDPPISNLETATDLLVHRTLEHDKQESDRRFELVQRAVGDILPVKWHCRPWWTMGLTWKVIDLIGMEALMFGMVDEPENVHRLMAWMRDEHHAYLDWMEASGLLTPNNEGEYCGSGGCGYSDELHPPAGGPAPLSESWGFSESQETVGISPDMFAEFILPYQASLVERFGLVYYGCCEPIDLRWEHVKTLPRLRRVSVSPWCNEAAIAPELRGRYVYCRKPNPAPLCIDFDEPALSASIDHTLQTAAGCAVELIMKDTHTCQHDPSRFGRWVELARRRIDLLWDKS